MSRKQKKYHYIYRTTNVLNGKFYIGMHSTDDLDDGYLGSGKRLRYSIKKYGVENHIKEIVEFCSDRKNLVQRETEIVNTELIGEFLCMNIAPGGLGGFISDSHQKKATEASVEKRQWLWKNDQEWRDEQIKRRSEYMTEAHKEDRHPGWKTYDWSGKKHTEEAKENMSNTHKDRRHQKGEKNSQFGTCWIYNTDEKRCIKINKEDINQYLDKGWLKGRKMKF